MRRGPCDAKQRRKANRQAFPLSDRHYDQCAGAVKFWLDRGLSEETAQIMADARRSSFNPLVR